MRFYFHRPNNISYSIGKDGCISMELNNEQLSKLIDLSELQLDINSISSEDINKALIAIERKLYSFSMGEPPAGASDLNILIVDDLELSIYQFNQLLKRIGITPTVARNKTEAFAEIKKKRFDYIIVDLFLPDSEDGFELINKCINLRETKGLNKIIVTSGTDDKNLVERCYKLGIDEFIPKNVNWHDQILKYITNSITQKNNSDFLKYSINENICCYTLNKFNNQKHIDEIMKDVATSLYMGFVNIIFNMENIKMFDEEYTRVFTELYRLCQEKNGTFTLVKISDPVKNALADAFLDNIIPIYSSTDMAVSKLSK